MAKMTLEAAAKALGLTVNATPDEVKKAYRKLAKQFHPDRITDEAEKKRAAKIFAKISEAYSVFEQHFATQNTNNGTRRTPPNQGAGQNTGGAQRPGDTGRTRANPGAQRPGGDTRRTTGNSADGTQNDPMVKVYWASYQRACKDLEDFIKKQLDPSNKKLLSIEAALRQAMDKQDLNTISRLASVLAALAQSHKFLIGQVQVYERMKDVAFKNYNAALARASRTNPQRG